MQYTNEIDGQTPHDSVRRAMHIVARLKAKNILIK